MTIRSLTCGCEQLQLSDPLLERLHTNPKSTLDRQKSFSPQEGDLWPNQQQSGRRARPKPFIWKFKAKTTCMNLFKNGSHSKDVNGSNSLPRAWYCSVSGSVFVVWTPTLMIRTLISHPDDEKEEEQWEAVSSFVKDIYKNPRKFYIHFQFVLNFFAPKALYFSTSNKVLGLCSLTGPTAFSPACCRCLRAPPSRSTPHFAL